MVKIGYVHLISYQFDFRARPDPLLNVGVVSQFLSGKTAHVPNRLFDSYKEASPPKSALHEADSVAPEKSLEDPRIPRNGVPDSKIFPLTLKVLAPRSKVCRYTHSDTPREGWGAHLGDLRARGTWSLPESMLHINYLELKQSFWP